MVRIPIAEDCYSTFYLKKNNLYNEANYFDWLVISPSAVHDMFKNDFVDFFELDNLRFFSKNTNEFKKTDITVKDIKYDVYYLHHFNSIDKDYETLKDKFNRRINRMNDHFKNNEPIEFYYKPCLYDFIKLDNHEWGTLEMKRLFPSIKNTIISKYNYENPDLITIKYL